MMNGLAIRGGVDLSSPIMASRKQANRVGQGPRVLAGLGLIVPILVWLCQVAVYVWFWQVAVYRVTPPANSTYMAIALVEGCMLVTGAVCSILALALGSRAGARVILPAIIGLVISGGTVLLVSFQILSLLFAHAPR
jgi:hypothetical protein